jgi:hypothetical protein
MGLPRFIQTLAMVHLHCPKKRGEVGKINLCRGTCSVILGNTFRENAVETHEFSGLHPTNLNGLLVASAVLRF